jgi:DNA-binding transcriptional regulator YiaG
VNGLAKLTDDDVRAIRREALHASQESVARAFGVNQTCVSSIVRRRTWKHVQ